MPKTAPYQGIIIDAGKTLRLGGSHAGSSNPRMVGGKMIGLRIAQDAKIVLDPAKLLLLGGDTAAGGNTRMIGKKWSPTANS